jgi:hypothetical protein
VIEFTFSGAVHTQTLYLCAGSLVVRGRCCIIIGSCCILTAKDNNVDLSCNIIISNNMVVVVRLLLLSRLLILARLLPSVLKLSTH